MKVDWYQHKTIWTLEPKIFITQLFTTKMCTSVLRITEAYSLLGYCCATLNKDIKPSISFPIWNSKDEKEGRKETGGQNITELGISNSSFESSWPQDNDLSFHSLSAWPSSTQENFQSKQRVLDSNAITIVRIIQQINACPYIHPKIMLIILWDSINWSSW